MEKIGNANPYLVSSVASKISFGEKSPINLVDVLGRMGEAK